MKRQFTVCIDPGHGGTKGCDFFREGKLGLREEEVNVRVALALERLLKEDDVNVVLTRREDRFIELQERVDSALEKRADLFVSVHHSIARDPTLNYSIVYFHKNAVTNRASVDFASTLAYYFEKGLKLSSYVYSDHLVFSHGLHVLRNLKDDMPAVIGEASFLSHPENELLLQREDHLEKEARCYREAIIEYFDGGIPSYKLVSGNDDNDIIIELDDGFGGVHFLDNSLEVIIDGKHVPHKLTILKKLVVIEDKKKFGPGDHELYLLGQNKKNNNLHPKPFVFTNHTDGTEWNDYIEEGKKLYKEAGEFSKENNCEKMKNTVDKAIEAFKHSLRILPVHEKVDEVYYFLILCGKLIGDKNLEAQYIRNLTNYVPGSEYLDQIDA